MALQERVEGAGLGDKRQITGTFADTLSGAILPRCSCCIRAKLIVAMQNLLFQVISTFITHQIKGK